MACERQAVKLLLELVCNIAHAFGPTKAVHSCFFLDARKTPNKDKGGANTT